MCPKCSSRVIWDDDLISPLTHIVGLGWIGTTNHDCWLSQMAIERAREIMIVATWKLVGAVSAVGWWNLCSWTARSLEQVREDTVANQQREDIRQRMCIVYCPRMQKMARQSAAMKKGLPFLNWIQETRETTVHLCVKGRACWWSSQQNSLGCLIHVLGSSKTRINPVHWFRSFGKVRPDSLVIL